MSSQQILCLHLFSTCVSQTNDFYVFWAARVDLRVVVARLTDTSPNTSPQISINSLQTVFQCDCVCVPVLFSEEFVSARQGNDEMDVLHQNNKDFFSHFEALPSVLVSKVLSYVPYTDKLSAVQAFPKWLPHLCTAEAWPDLMYVDHPASRIKDRQEICQCLRVYGRYIKKISLNFHYHVRNSGTSLLKKVASNCTQLQCIQLVEIDIDADRAVKNILDSCESLRDVSLVRPWVDWSRHNNTVALVTTSNHSKKLTELVAVPETTDLEFDFSKVLQPQRLMNLHTLKVKRSFLHEDVLLQLASQKLIHVSIFQDKELPLDQCVLYKEETWNEVLSHKPKFCFHVALRNIVMLRTFFPAQAPLKALILADLQASITKGVLDTISENYHPTLESFVCTKSNAYETVDVEDRRLPCALLDLTRTCAKLKTLVYGFNISSAVILLIAKESKFHCFDIPLDSLSFSCDLKNLPSSEVTNVEWLKQYASTVDRLEEEVSALQGYEWRLSTEPREKKIQHYFRYF